HSVDDDQVGRSRRLLRRARAPRRPACERLAQGRSPRRHLAKPHSKDQQVRAANFAWFLSPAGRAPTALLPNSAGLLEDSAPGQARIFFVSIKAASTSTSTDESFSADGASRAISSFAVSSSVIVELTESCVVSSFSAYSVPAAGRAVVASSGPASSRTGSWDVLSSKTSSNASPKAAAASTSSFIGSVRVSPI